MEPKLIGESYPSNQIRRGIAAVAQSDATVLITGETGTGKGLIARLIHSQSMVASGPFVHVDCASLAESLIESDLFGHDRGAFTGAYDRRVGKFEQAQHGTIFLDEIGELEPRTQSKLLRVLQDREFERIGGNRTLRMTARVIAATNQDLTAAVQSKRFRADLFFRLAVARIQAPPLRDRVEDIAALVRHETAVLSAKMNIPEPEIDPSFIEAILQYRWPGNIRELFNVLERVLLFCKDQRLTSDILLMHDCLGVAPELSNSAADRSETLSLNRAECRSLKVFRLWIKEQEQAYFLELSRNYSSFRERAAVSGLPERTLYRKLRAFLSAPSSANGAQLSSVQEAPPTYIDNNVCAARYR